MQKITATRTQWHHIIIIICIGISTAFYIGKVPPALPFIRSELEMDLVTAGWVVSIFNALGTVIGIAVGLLADRIGPGRVITVSLIILPLASVIGSFSGSVEILLCSRVLEGIGYASIFVAGPALIALMVSEKERAAAVSLWSSTTPIGMTLAVVLAPILLEPFGWRSLWIGTALFSLGIFAIFQRTIVPELRPIPKRTVTPWRHVKTTVTKLGPCLLAIAFMTYTFQWMAIMVWLPTFAVEERELNIGIAAILAATAIAVNIPGNWFGSWLVHKGIARWTIITIGSSAMGISSLLIFSDSFPDNFRYGMILVFSFLGGLQPAALISGTTFHTPTPAQLGATNGLLYQGSQCGQFIGPPAIAIIVTATGVWETAGVLLFALTLINISIAIAIRYLELA